MDHALNRKHCYCYKPRERARIRARARTKKIGHGLGFGLVHEIFGTFILKRMRAGSIPEPQNIYR